MTTRKTRNASRVFRIIGHVFLGVAAAVFFALLFGIGVMYLWNWLMPGLFNLATIGFWQAFGLTLLARLLVGGLHPGHPHGDHWNHKFEPSYPIPDDARRHRREYRDFWREEGRAAFEEYLRRRGAKEPESPETGKGEKPSAQGV